MKKETLLPLMFLLSNDKDKIHEIQNILEYMEDGCRSNDDEMWKDLYEYDSE